MSGGIADFDLVKITWPETASLMVSSFATQNRSASVGRLSDTKALTQTLMGQSHFASLRKQQLLIYALRKQQLTIISSRLFLWR